MYGFILSELKKYVTAKHGDPAWKSLMKEAGLGTKIYLATQEYPDSEVITLVNTAAKLAGKPVPTLLEDFGQFMVPTMMSTYRVAIKPQWRTMDLLEHVEEQIHQVVRRKNPNAKPPVLKCARISPSEVVITYGSHRKMCAVAKGIARGVAKHYRESIVITETSCMLKGGANCTMSIKLMKGMTR